MSQSCRQPIVPGRHFTTSGICCASTSGDGGSRDIPPGRKSRGSSSSVGGSSGGSATSGGSGGRGGKSGHLSCPKCGDPCTHVETFVCKSKNVYMVLLAYNAHIYLIFRQMWFINWLIYLFIATDFVFFYGSRWVCGGCCGILVKLYCIKVKMKIPSVFTMSEFIQA